MSSTGVNTQVEAKPLPPPASTSFQKGTGLLKVAAFFVQARFASAFSTANKNGTFQKWKVRTSKNPHAPKLSTSTCKTLGGWKFWEPFLAQPNKETFKIKTLNRNLNQIVPNQSLLENHKRPLHPLLKPSSHSRRTQRDWHTRPLSPVKGLPAHDRGRRTPTPPPSL